MRRSRLAGLALALLTASPLWATDAIRPADARVAAVAYRLAIAGRGLCPAAVPQTGIVLHYLADYTIADQAEADRAWGLASGPGILAVVPDSPAAAAGLHAGDVLLAIDGRPAPAGQRSGPRIGRADPAAPLLEAGGERPVALRIRRDGDVLDIVLRPRPGCPIRARLAVNDQVNAFADGRAVIVTSALLATLRSDDELAFVIGHELGHIVAGRAHGAADELAADAFAARLMRAAGYDLAAMPALVRRIGDDPLAFLSDHPGTAARIRAWNVAAAPDGAAATPHPPGTR